MKKIVIALLLSLFVILTISSCKSKDCPAYTQADVEITDQKG